MAIISFEGIAGDGEAVKTPDSYRDLDWKNFWAADDEFNQGTALATTIHSGEASAFNGGQKPVTFRSPDHDKDFDFNSGFFAAFNANDLEVKVFGYDDSERVAAKVFLLDEEQEFVTFGSKFNDIDKVRIVARGGTDADLNDNLPAFQYFAVDDLFIDF